MLHKGDLVKVLSGAESGFELSYSQKRFAGHIGIVMHVHTSTYAVGFPGEEIPTLFLPDKLVLLNRAADSQTTNQGESLMNPHNNLDYTGLTKVSDMSADNQTLFNGGMIDQDGNPTEQGKTLALKFIFDSVKPDILATVQKINAAIEAAKTPDTGVTPVAE